MTQMQVPPRTSPPAAPKTRHVPWWGIALIALTCFLVGVGVGNGPSTSGSVPPVSVPTPYSATPAPRSVAPAPVPTIEGIAGGTYEVGAEIAPGKYHTAGPEPGLVIDMCYWARLKDTSGDLGSIIANDNISGPTTITIKPGDGAFNTSNCQPWTKVD